MIWNFKADKLGPIGPVGPICCPAGPPGPPGPSSVSYTLNASPYYGYVDFAEHTQPLKYAGIETQAERDAIFIRHVVADLPPGANGFWRIRGSDYDRNYIRIGQVHPDGSVRDEHGVVVTAASLAARAFRVQEEKGAGVNQKDSPFKYMQEPYKGWFWRAEIQLADDGCPGSEQFLRIDINPDAGEGCQEEVSITLSLYSNATKQSRQLLQSSLLELQDVVTLLWPHYRICTVQTLERTGK